MSEPSPNAHRPSRARTSETRRARWASCAVRVGERIREVRTERRLTQEDLAELADIHHKQVGRLERGESNVTIATLVAVADALRVRPGDLLEGVDAPTSEE